MLIFITLILVVTSLLLAWLSKSVRIWRFCWVNVAVMLIYDLAGGFYISNFIDGGGANVVPMLILLGLTALHIALLFVAIIVMTMHRAVKDQQGK